MTTAAEISVAPPSPWGNRTKLLPKSMRYVLSLDVSAAIRGSYLEVKASSERCLRHLLDHAVVMMPEGLPCDVPFGTIASGDGEMGTSDDPWSSHLRMRLRVQLSAAGGTTAPPATMNLECVGSVTFDGGMAAAQECAGIVTGSAFISTYQEVSRPSFRWLARRQLFGVGRVEGRVVGGEKVLAFSFDLYAAA